jgi:hypothetical protein
MNLTNEEKKVIADKMGWRFNIVNFDLNDASLVVDELVKQGKWSSFEIFAGAIFLNERQCDCICHKCDEYIAWFMTMQNGEATNFFRAYYQWVKENER